jgi:hypothetical protein
MTAQRTPRAWSRMACIPSMRRVQFRFFPRIGAHMEPFVPTSKAQDEYTGPEELRVFADILPYIGELAISFSRLERRVTWAIESLLYSTPDEAHEMEDFVKNFSARLKFLELIGKHVSRETAIEKEFDALISGIRDANRFRNDAIHHAFTGIKGTLEKDGTLSCIEVMKERYAEKPVKRPYAITTSEIRKNVETNLALCSDIQRWVLTVRPGAQNRVP